MISIDEYLNLPKKITIFMIYIKLFIIILFIQPIVSFYSSANTPEHNNLINFVKSEITKNIDTPINGKLEIKVASLDPRIKIKPCLSKLNANIPENHKGRNVNVKIVCKDPIPWKIYIPVKINRTIPVLVATKVLVKGSVINRLNTTIEYRNENSMRGENVSDITKVAGGRLKRRLSKGGVISPRNICLVCKGEAVTIIAKSDGFTIKTKGSALSDGSIDQEVRIKNSGSGRIINARVVSINKVVINL